MIRSVTRREILTASGTVGGLALAGCLGAATGGEATNTGCSGEQRTVDVPSMGNPNAAITVVMYEDFGCPHCKEYVEGVFPTIETGYIEPGVVRYERRDFPVPVDETWSWKVPNAAFTVLEDAGKEAYFGFAETIYEFQGNYSVDLIADRAATFGASADAVREAVENEPFCEQIAESRTEALDRGVGSTPTVFVNDRMLEAPSIRDVAEAIENER